MRKIIVVSEVRQADLDTAAAILKEAKPAFVRAIGEVTSYETADDLPGLSAGLFQLSQVATQLNAVVALFAPDETIDAFEAIAKRGLSVLENVLDSIEAEAAESHKTDGPVSPEEFRAAVVRMNKREDTDQEPAAAHDQAHAPHGPGGSAPAIEEDDDDGPGELDSVFGDEDDEEEEEDGDPFELDTDTEARSITPVVTPAGASRRRRQQRLNAAAKV